MTFAGFALFLGVLVVLCFPQVVFGLESFVTRDFGHFAYPLAFYQRQSFWRGEVPLWNPYNECGVPFLAQWNTMPLYPPALIYLVFPLSWSPGFFCLLHLWFAGLGMYWLALNWSGNRVAAVRQPAQQPLPGMGADYDKYLDEFVRQCDPTVLSYDNYPLPQNAGFSYGY